jgi:hypothetical protein
MNNIQRENVHCDMPYAWQKYNSPGTGAISPAIGMEYDAMASAALAKATSDREKYNTKLEAQHRWRREFEEWLDKPEQQARTRHRRFKPHVVLLLFLLAFAWLGAGWIGVIVGLVSLFDGRGLSQSLVWGISAWGLLVVAAAVVGVPLWLCDTFDERLSAQSLRQLEREWRTVRPEPQLPTVHVVNPYEILEKAKYQVKTRSAARHTAEAI